MQIKTKFHGEIEIAKDQQWTFPKGMPGFEEEKSFVLLPIEGNELFQVLQSTATAHVAFIVTSPFTFVKDYTFKIDEPTLDLLKIEEQQDLFILAVLSLKDPFETSTINLQAPLIFHSKNKQAKQMILNNHAYAMKHPIGSEQKGEK